MKKINMGIVCNSQDYTAYQAEDHKTWATLTKRQRELLSVKISREYLNGFERLQLDEKRIVNIDEISEQLNSITGWSLVPVTGLIPTRDFFFMLLNKKYPITISIRKPWEINFSEQPDIFHDVYGHLPLLTNEKFLKFLTAYSIIAFKYVNNEKAIDFLGRLYWFTYEMGIINEDGENKPYGGAIITSAEEITNINNKNIPKHPFNLNHIFHTPYNPYKLQNEYFIINSFDDLFNSLENIESTLIESLSRLTPEEENKLLVEFNNTAFEYPKEKTVIDLFYEQSSKTPDAIAVVFGQKHVTYKELNERSNQLAHYLNNKGVKSETLVPISLERTIEMIIGMLGIMKAGGAYVPIDPALPVDRMEYMIENTGANIIVSNSICKSKLPVGAQDIIELDGDWEIIEKESKKIPENSVRSGQLAYVIYTSGTTGKPKGVMIEHSGLVNVCIDHIKEFSMTGADRYLQFMSPSFDGSILDIFSTLLSGASLILPGKEALSSSENFIQFVSQHKITIFTITPSFLTILNKHKLSGVKTIVSAGEAAIPEDAMYYGSFKNFYNGYGPSEVTVNATLFKLNTSKEYSRIPIGKPRSNKCIYILNNEMNLCPVGVEGEIYIAGVGLARGYLNQPELTVEKFIADPFSKRPGARMYKTGDIGRWLPDGNIEFLGRQDDQVKINGYRIELGEIEAVLHQSDLIRQAVVLAREDSNGNKRLVAYVVAEGLFDRKAIISYLKGWLPDYMIPPFWMELENFPLTANGKIDKKSLPEFDQTIINENYVAPRNEAEMKLAKIWEEILEVERVGIHDNFFELGGHSLAILKLVSHVRELGLHIQIDDLFEYQTIEQQSDFIKTSLKLLQTASEGKFVIPIQSAGNNFPIFGIPEFLLYSEIGKYISKEQPFYSIEHSPYPGVKEVVGHYIAEIKKTYPKGPYGLMGYCDWGKTILEIAQTLIDNGDEVPVLVLTEFYSPTIEIPRVSLEYLGQRKRYIRRKLRGERSIAGKGKIIYKELKFILKFISRKFILTHNKNRIPEITYNGKVILFQASETYGFKEDLRMGWGNMLTGDVKKFMIEGDHVGMMVSPKAATQMAEILNAELLNKKVGEAQYSYE